MVRIDFEETMRRIDISPEIYAWLDLFGDVLAATQEEALQREHEMTIDSYVSDTAYKMLLVRSINKDLSSLNAIGILLRFELIHQAAAHVRLFCEGLITLSYISKDPKSRVPLFLEYSGIETYEIAHSLLEWERHSAKAEHVAAVEKILSERRIKYEELRPRYTTTDRRGRRRPYINWCNTSVSVQAKECGPEIEKLYRLVYSQMSAYIHGSAWSLRRQYSYSRVHYDGRVVQNDIANMVRIVIAVWLEWAKLCDARVGWKLFERAPSIAAKCDALDAAQFVSC